MVLIVVSNLNKEKKYVFKFPGYGFSLEYEKTPKYTILRVFRIRRRGCEG